MLADIAAGLVLGVIVAAFVWLGVSILDCPPDDYVSPNPFGEQGESR